MPIHCTRLKRVFTTRKVLGQFALRSISHLTIQNISTAALTWVLDSCLTSVLINSPVRYMLTDKTCSLVMGRANYFKFMKKPILSKLYLIVFGALLAVQNVFASKKEFEGDYICLPIEFSGATRSEELLLASRPLGIKVQETSIPDNYLVFAAGETDQIAGVEPDVKHGRFSYFVFKGLEGEADANQDGKISAGELHKYVRESVGRFSAGAQTPTMLGDGSRWVLR